MCLETADFAVPNGLLRSHAPADARTNQSRFMSMLLFLANKHVWETLATNPRQLDWTTI